MRIRLSRIIISAVCLMAGTPASAFELAGGVVAVEEGDDRHRPASALHLGFNDRYVLKSFMYGRKHGPFLERVSVLSLNHRFPLYSGKSNFSASIGGTTLLEQTMYKAQNETEKDESKNQFNMGMSFGAAYTMPFKHAYISLAWDANLYLAGSQGLLLVVGRKHMLGPVFGMRF